MPNTKIAEVIADNGLIHTAEDGLDLLTNVYYQDINKIILHEKHFNPLFFDLKTGIAGDLLQKFSNYRVRLVIIGNFKHFDSESLKAFVHESNMGSQVNFLPDLDEAIKRLST